MLSPARPETLAAAGQIHLRRGQYADAAAGDREKGVALLRKVLAIDPGNAASHLQLGLALLQAGQPGEAIDQLNAAARLDEGPEVHRHLAEAFTAAGRPADASREQSIYVSMKQQALRQRT